MKELPLRFITPEPTGDHRFLERRDQIKICAIDLIIAKASLCRQFGERLVRILLGVLKEVFNVRVVTVLIANSNLVHADEARSLMLFEVQDNAHPCFVRALTP